jgi:hypothetical protein
MVVRYTGSTHGKSGAVLILLSSLVTAVDLMPIIVRQLSTLRSMRLTSIVKWVRKAREPVTTRSHPAPSVDEECMLIIQPTGKHDACFSSTSASVDRDHSSLDEIDMLNSTSNFDGQHTNATNSTGHWNPKVSENYLHVSRHSLGSDHSTLHDEPPRPHAPELYRTTSQHITQVAKFCLLVLERSLVPYAWGQALSGFAIYFGLGRTHYVTGVLAHFISKHASILCVIAH